MIAMGQPGPPHAHLKVFEGKRITLRNLGRSFAITLPGAAESSAAGGQEGADTSVTREGSGATEGPGAEAAAARPTEGEPVEDDGVPLFMPEPPEEPRVRETLTYTATFDGEVIVDQFEGQTQTGLLSADRLAFLFDFGQEQRDLVRRHPTSQPERHRPSDADTLQPTGYEDDSQVVLHWKGPLVVDRVRDPAGAAAAV